MIAGDCGTDDTISSLKKSPTLHPNTSAIRCNVLIVGLRLRFWVKVNLVIPISFATCSIVKPFSLIIVLTSIFLIFNNVRFYFVCKDNEYK